MTVQPTWVIVGDSFTIECRVPAVAPLEKLTLTLLHGNESLHRQTFEGATAALQEAMTTYNRTAHREDGRYNFSCQAELDLLSRGGNIIRMTSKSQGLEIYGEGKPPGQREGMTGHSPLAPWEIKTLAHSLPAQRSRYPRTPHLVLRVPLMLPPP